MISQIFKNYSSVFLLLFMLVFPLVGSSLGILFITTNEPLILEFTSMHWVVFYLITSFTMAFAFTPTTLVALATGYFVGWNGLFGLIPSYLLASFIGFSLASQLDRGALLYQLTKREKIKQLIVNLKRDEFWVIFFCRISPALPFAMMNVFLSFMKTKRRTFISGSLLGMLPRTLLSIWIGTQAKDILRMFEGKEEPDASKVLVIALLFVSVVGLYLLTTRALKKQYST